MRLSSTAFEHGAEIPRRHSCEGDDLSPPLRWEDVPAGAAALALICDDPDAPSGTFDHWLAWGLDAEAGELDEGEAAPVEGENGFGELGYRGPCPPPGHGRHRYFFRLYALDAPVDAGPGAGRAELDQAIESHVLDLTELIGTYER